MIDSRIKFREYHEKAISLLESQDSLFKQANTITGNTLYLERVEQLKVLINSLKEHEFVVVVIGSFNRGKSTFLNALLGKYIFVKDANECTASVAFLKHKDRRNDSYNNKAVVHFRNNSSEKIIEASELIEYTTKLAQKVKVAEAVEYVEIFSDSKFVEDNVTLVDTPGVETTNENHLAITYDQIAKSHAAIFLLNGQPSRGEIDFLNDIRNNIQHFFFVVNKIDQIAEKDKERVYNKIREELNIRVSIPIPEEQLHIFGISALQALLGRHGYIDPNELVKEQDKNILDEQKYRDELVKESNIEEFENTLIDYLFKGGKAKDILRHPLNNSLMVYENLRNTYNEQLEVMNGLVGIDEINQKELKLHQELKDKKNELLEMSDQLSSKLESKLDKGFEEIEIELNRKEAELKELVSSYTLYQTLLYDWDNGEEISILPTRMLEYSKLRCIDILKENINSFFKAEDRRIRSQLNDISGIKNIPDLIIPEISLKFAHVEIPQDEKTKLEDMEQKINDLEKEENALIEKHNPALENVLIQLQAQRDKLERDRNSQIMALGAKPKLQALNLQQTVIDNREGVFGKIGQFFNGKSEKIVVKIVDNSAEIKAYNDTLVKLDAAFEAGKKALDRQISDNMSNLPENKRTELKAIRLTEEIKRKEEKQDQLKLQLNQTIKDREEMALRTVKINIIRSFEKSKEQLLQQFKHIINSNKELVNDFLENKFLEMNEEISNNLKELEALKSLKDLKLNEKQKKEELINIELEKINTFEKEAHDLMNDLESYFKVNQLESELV